MGAPEAIPRPYVSWEDVDPEDTDEAELPVVWAVLEVLRGMEPEYEGRDRQDWMDVIREVPGYSPHVAIDGHTRTAARIRGRIYEVAMDKETA